MADRRKEQNKKAQQRFREKRQKEVEELQSSFRSLKDEMSSLQSALDAAQKENSLLKSELDKQVHTSAAKYCSAATDDQETSFLDFLSTEDHASHGWLHEAVGMVDSNSPQITPMAGSPGFFFDRDGSGTPLFCEAALVTGDDDMQAVDAGQRDDGNTISQNAMCSDMAFDAPPSTRVDSNQGLGYGISHETDSRHNVNNLNAADILDVPQRAPQKDANYYIPSLSLSSNVPETGWSMAASTDSGTRLMCLFSQLLSLEYARISSVNQTQGIF